MRSVAEDWLWLNGQIDRLNERYREFSDVVVFRSPPQGVQRTVFGALAPLARWRGYRGTYPQFSRTMLAPRESS